MRRPIRWAPGFRFDEIEWNDAPRVAKKQLADWLNRQRKRVKRIGLELAADKAREDRQMAFQAQLAREDAATARMLEGYRAVLRAAAKKQHEENATWLKQAKARAEKVGREIERDRLRAERELLVRRGVVRGRSA